MSNLLTPQEAAKRLAIAPKTLGNWLRDGRIRGIKLGWVWRISEDELSRFLTEMTVDKR